jgi:hypothetical protein
MHNSILGREKQANSQMERDRSKRFWTSPPQNWPMNYWGENAAPAQTAWKRPGKLRGFSAIDAPGQPFFDPEANHAFIEALKKNLPPHIPVIEKQAQINAPSFAGDLAWALLELLRVRGEDSWESKR